MVGGAIGLLVMPERYLDGRTGLAVWRTAEFDGFGDELRMAFQRRGWI